MLEGLPPAAEGAATRTKKPRKSDSVSAEEVPTLRNLSGNGLPRPLACWNLPIQHGLLVAFNVCSNSHVRMFQVHDNRV